MTAQEWYDRLWGVYDDMTERTLAGPYRQFILDVAEQNLAPVLSALEFLLRQGDLPKELKGDSHD